jgi:SAM-dependent methyltransferase
MLDFKSIRDYWEERASSDGSVQSTTQDVYLREIELRALSAQMARFSPMDVADVGCGDGRTTLHLAKQFPTTEFFGCDYSPAMIKNANRVLSNAAASNVKFGEHDICEPIQGSYDLIYTTRCLINLPSWDLQKKGIENIFSALRKGGIYVMVENFIEGHNNFNKIRSQYNLPEIKVRDHNLFFDRRKLLDFTSGLFDIEYEVNISSTYYLVSRVIYSKLCDVNSVIPDYHDLHHQYAAGLPFCGEYGPVRLLCLKKVEE